MTIGGEISPELTICAWDATGASATNATASMKVLKELLIVSKLLCSWFGDSAPAVKSREPSFHNGASGGQGCQKCRPRPAGTEQGDRSEGRGYGSQEPSFASATSTSNSVRRSKPKSRGSSFHTMRAGR